MVNKKTLVIGASSNPERYSNKAIQKLLQHKHTVKGFAIKADEAYGVSFSNNWNDFKEIHTVTMYMSAKNQEAYYQNIINLKPQRVIFNPGTENPEFEELLHQNGVAFEEACTLVLLSSGQF
jgi:uncharacterized protein